MLLQRHLKAREGHLSIREPTLTIVCGRRGRYNVKQLIAAHGADAKLPDLGDSPRRPAEAISLAGLPGRHTYRIVVNMPASR